MATDNSTRDFAVDVVRRLRSAGYDAFFAGGCVRDLLLNRPAKDFDVATNARPEEVRKLFGYKNTLAVGASFGVIMVQRNHGELQVEVATFRKEGPYLDGRRPSEVEFCSVEDDAQRRDFTINGMYLDPISDQVLDLVGGQADLAAKTIRAIRNPFDRIAEDKLRMLRAVRFAATLDFSIDELTGDAIRQTAAEVRLVSAERIAQELRRMLVDRNRRRAIHLMAELQLLRAILSELNSSDETQLWDLTLARLELLESPTFELALAALVMSLPAKPVVQTICRRWKLSNDELNRTVWLVEHQTDLNTPQSLSLAQLKRRLAHPWRDELLCLIDADRKARGMDLEPVAFCREYLRQTPPEVIDPPPLLTGDDMIALGLRPGPRFKEILSTVRDAQLDLTIHSRDEAIAMAMTEWSR